MLGYALAFLIIGLIAGLVGLAGVAAVATHVGWILFLVGLVLLIVHAAVRGRVPPLSVRSCYSEFLAVPIALAEKLAHPL
ncbi:MAG: DUF1328 domain-containing protein [Candidatus Binatia bacterium]